MSRSPSTLIIVGNRTFPMLMVYLLEQKVKVGNCGAIEIKIVARFLHAMPYDESIVKASRMSSREYLLRLGSKQKHVVKRITINNRVGINGHGIRDNKRDIIARIITLKNEIASSQISSNIPENTSSNSVNSAISDCNSGDPTSKLPISNNKPFKFTNSPPKNRSVEEAAAWLRKYFPAYVSTFVNYSGIDLLNLTRQEFIQFCGRIDGVRLYKKMTEENPRPKLFFYAAIETDDTPTWRFVALHETTSEALTSKLSSVFTIPKAKIHSVWMQGPQGICMLMCDNLVENLKTESIYWLQILSESPVGFYKLILKPFKG